WCGARVGAPHGNPRSSLVISHSAVRTAPVAPMPDKNDFGLNEGHETTRGGERVLIRPVRPEDTALYRAFLADVSAEHLRLRFFARMAELSADEIDKLSHLNYQHEMALSPSTKRLGACSGSCASNSTKGPRNSRSWSARRSRVTASVG